MTRKEVILLNWDANCSGYFCMGECWEAEALSNECLKVDGESVYGIRGHEKDTSYVFGTNLSVARLDTWVMTVVRCLAEEERRGG